MFIKKFCFILFFSGTCFVSATFSSCPQIVIQHGKIRYKNQGRQLRVFCFKPFILVGNRKIECEDGEWNGAVPVCASKNCDTLPKLLHGTITYFNDKAESKIQCNPDFTLIGSPQMYCAGDFGWNDTVIPECRANSIHQFGICHFEPNETKQCEWVSKSDLFNWTIMSSRREDNTPTTLDGFPSHDHTLSGSNSAGHFLYLKTFSAETKSDLSLMNTNNVSAKYISPLFPPLDDDEPYCLIFYLYANGLHAGIVEVLVNEDIIWRSNGSLGIEWKKINIPLHNRSTFFRITIEGKGELGEYTRTAIDDLRIANGTECQENHQIGVSVDLGVEQSVTKSFTGNEEYEKETEGSHELVTNKFIFSTPPYTSKFKNTSTFTTSATSINQKNYIASSSTTDDRNGLKANLINNENMPEENNSFIKVEDSNSTTEIIITQNNVIFQSNTGNKNEDNKTSVIGQEIYMNSSRDHKNYDGLRINIPTNSSSFNESLIKQENQEFNNDMTILQHEFPNEEKQIFFNISVASTTHLISISNNTVVKPNDAKDKYNHQKENRHDEVQEKGDYSGHLENEKNVLQKINKQNGEINSNYHAHSDYAGNSNGSEIIWLAVFVVSGVVLLLFGIIYKRLYKNKRSADGSIQFLERDGSSNDLSGTNENILVLKNVSLNL